MTGQTENMTVKICSTLTFINVLNAILQFYRVAKALQENIIKCTLLNISHANKTTKDCIQY